jgi:uracil-DNA glycosylase
MSFNDSSSTTHLKKSNSSSLPSDWHTLLKDEFKKEYFLDLKEFVIGEREIFSVFPETFNLFRAFIETRFNNLKVVILGQDPYHKKGQAHGLAFSVPDNIPIPPSLNNIFQELESDLGIKAPRTGNLTKWANRGVFLLNTILTVREGQANSHREQGWEIFTDKVINLISEKKENVVFILWGKNAQAKKHLIDTSKHLILAAPHPSPLSAYRGFFGSKPFSQTNEFLVKTGQTPINWQID